MNSSLRHFCLFHVAATIGWDQYLQLHLVGMGLATCFRKKEQQEAPCPDNGSTIPIPTLDAYQGHVRDLSLRQHDFLPLCWRIVQPFNTDDSCLQ